MSDARSGFAWYLAGAVCQFLPFGIHNVLYAWLIAVYLGESGIRLGIAQMCAQLPGLLFILFGGLLADRVDRRKILMGFHLLAALPALLLALAISAGYLNYLLLIVFAVAVSTFNSFIQPARDSLLNQVTTFDLQRSVTMMMGLMFGSQVFGYAIASGADSVGPVWLLVVQGLILFLGFVFAWKLPSYTPARASLADASARAARGALGDIGDGLGLIFRSPSMSPVMILMIAVGVFYSGAFFVVNPLVVRDIYGGGSADIALSYICFMVGTVFTTVIMIAMGGVRRQGLGLMLALVIGGLCLSTTYLGLPFAGYLVAIGFWGVAAGVSMSLGRSIVQEAAPEEYRARAMSIYSLGNLGGMPVGSLLMGFAAVWLGPLESYLLGIAGIMVVVLLVWLYTDLARVYRMDQDRLEGEMT